MYWVGENINICKVCNRQGLILQNKQIDDTILQQLKKKTEKWEKDLNIYPHIQMVNRHMKRCLTLVIIRKIRLKLQYTLHWSERPSLKNL